MSESPAKPDPADDLQFQTAEAAEDNPTDTPGQQCIVCSAPITDTYYAVGEQVLCPSCATAVQAPPPGTPFGRFLKATALGLGAGLVGAVIWFAIRRLAHVEVGLVAILVGFMVGKAVRAGSGHRGGLGYQILAVLLTYSCIAANYMPDAIEALIAVANENAEVADADANDATANGKETDIPGIVPAKEAAVPEDPASGENTPAEAPQEEPVEPLTAGERVVGIALILAIAFAFSLSAPFLEGTDNLIGLLIIGFALWEAWRFNAYAPLVVSGPYQVGAHGQQSIDTMEIPQAPSNDVIL